MTEDSDGTSLWLVATVLKARAEISIEDIEDLADALADQIAEESPDDVALLYKEIRALVDKEADTPTNTSRYQELLQRLRFAQAAEAEEMERYFERHRPLPKDAGSKAISFAEELLKKYEGIATSDSARSGPNKATS